MDLNNNSIYFNKKKNYVSSHVGGRDDNDDNEIIIKDQLNVINNRSKIDNNEYNKYDSYKEYLLENGLFDPDKNNNVRSPIHIDYEHIDSSTRNKNNLNITEEPISLENNPLLFSSITSNNVTFNNYLWISDPDHKLSVSDKITLTGLSPKTVVIRSILKGTSGDNVIFTDGSSYVKIMINPNIVNGSYNATLQAKIDSYDFSDVTVKIKGFKGSTYGSHYFFNIPTAVLNDTFQIYLNNPDDVTIWNGNHFFIKLPYSFSVGTSSYNNDGYNITFEFNHTCGVPNNLINADYPLDKTYQIGYHIVESIKTSKFAVVLKKEWLGDNGGKEFGKDLLYYSKISSTTMGYPNSNNYIAELCKEYKCLSKLSIVNSIFPAVENIFSNQKYNKNTYLYWQNRSDGDTVYSINIDSGTYDKDSLKKEIEKKVSEVKRISELEYDAYDKYNYITVEFNTDTNVTTFKSFIKYVFSGAPIIAMDPSASTTVGTYTLTIEQSSHNLSEGDYIEFTGMIDHYGIPASSLNSRFTIESIVDEDSYTIVLSGVNINTETISNNTGGGFNVIGLIDNYFRLHFNRNDTMGNNIGFRNVGTDIAVTEYKTVIKNTDPYLNEPSIDQNGNPTDYYSGKINLNKTPYFYICCDELKNRILLNKNNIKNINNIICKINCSKIKNGHYYDTFVDTPIFFYKPINLGHMTFSFYNPDGTLMDFGNLDHSFVLKLECYNINTAETNIDTTTGLMY